MNLKSQRVKLTTTMNRELLRALKQFALSRDCTLNEVIEPLIARLLRSQAQDEGQPDSLNDPSVSSGDVNPDGFDKTTVGWLRQCSEAERFCENMRRVDSALTTLSDDPAI